jgi:hypothetical protein
MRQVGDPNLINLAAGLPSVHCVPKADLREAFAATLEENADEALGYHVPDGVKTPLVGRGSRMASGFTSETNRWNSRSTCYAENRADLSDEALAL